MTKYSSAILSGGAARLPPEYPAAPLYGKEPTGSARLDKLPILDFTVAPRVLIDRKGSDGVPFRVAR
jgi:hypothetical protein